MVGSIQMSGVRCRISDSHSGSSLSADDAIIFISNISNPRSDILP